MDLVCGMIGVQANQREAVGLAGKHGFESVEARMHELAGMQRGQVEELLAQLKNHRLVWGAAGLPVDFRRDEEQFRTGMTDLPRLAEGLQRAGGSRVGTYLMPCHNELTYVENFRIHQRRLRQIAEVLNDHGIRFGLEYVGTETLRLSRRYPFVHTMAETRELIAAIDVENVGLILDSWHWWTSGDTEQELRSVKKEEVVAVDLNDAPRGIPKEEQRDNHRELPGATGVIDAGLFVRVLQDIGYNGPVRAEPFNTTLNMLDNEAACEVAIRSLRQVAGG